MDIPVRYSYFLRVDTERAKLYMLEGGFTDKTLAAKIGVSWQTVSGWKRYEWPLMSLFCTFMQVNPIIFLRAAQNGETGRWSVVIDSDLWLARSHAAGYTSTRFAKEGRVNRSTVNDLYRNYRETTWNAICGLGYGLDVSPLALLRVDEQ